MGGSSVKRSMKSSGVKVPGLFRAILMALENKFLGAVWVDSTRVASQTRASLRRLSLPPFPIRGDSPRARGNFVDGVARYKYLPLLLLSKWIQRGLYQEEHV